MQTMEVSVAINRPITQNPKSKAAKHRRKPKQQVLSAALAAGPGESELRCLAIETQGFHFDWDTGAALEEPLSRCDPDILITVPIDASGHLRRPPF